VTCEKVQAQHLRPGDVVGSGETVRGVSAGLRTPPGKVEVTLERNGVTRMSLWGARTPINVKRAEPVS
jgi:2-keto-4-pentenoate hydratase/2-oxohepta-3-ene-1,7-dioic acid hydratase in catechol pathway